MVSLAPAHDPQLLEAYQNVSRELRIRHAKVGCVLALVLVPAGSSLDYFVYPELLWPIFRIRLLCDLSLLPIFALLYTSFGRRHIWTFGTLWAMLPTFAICWMIYASEGVASPYYAGLNLMIIVTLQLIPYTLWEAILFCTLVISSYVIACVLHWSSGGGLLQERSAAEFSTLYNNLYFLALTSIISVTACYYSSLRRWEDFKLRHELDVRNRELNESYDRLAELDRLKSDFFANISHELRTPLTLIVSPIDDLLRRNGSLPADLRQALDLARQNGLRLLKLINDLLELVRLDQRKADLKRENLDLAAFASGLVESVRHLASLKGLSLRMAPADGPVPVAADPARIEKVVLNILTNAIKFTPAGGRIEVRCAHQEGQAVLEVQDTGPGIAATELPYIFDRFRQADSSSTRKYQGAGIGLALAREIVQEHGGRLTASSELGAGTTLRVALPIGTVHPEKLLASGEKEVEPDPIAKIYQDAERAIVQDLNSNGRPAPGPDAGSSAVLVVDDEPDMRRFITSTLSQEHAVLEAPDGEAALEAIAEHRPRLVVLDLMMPKIDGLGVCRRIKSDPLTARTKIILLTAKADEASKVTALELGADDFLTKPFSTLELKTRVSNLLLAEGLERDLRDRNEALERTLKQLQETEVQLIQSEKMNALGKLAAGLLHEINNPLNFTFVALQMAEASPKADEELKEIFRDIEDGMSRIRNVVSDLRTFAYPSHQSKQERFTIDEALTTALRLTAQEMKDISVQRDGLDRATAYGSKAQIVHVLMNLLVNSAHATAGTGRERQIRVEAGPREGRLQISVWDNGCGVRTEHLSRVFEPFFTTKDVGQGMGMGLSVCHTIIRNHGGTIMIHSEEGKWTRFTFDLSPAEQENTHESGVRLQAVCDPLRR